MILQIIQLFILERAAKDAKKIHEKPAKKEERTGEAPSTPGQKQ
jgi:hypothetical protein